MSILRIQKQRNYVVMDKGFLENKTLSWKAKGLLAYLLSLPDDWHINVKNLSDCASDGRDAVQAALRELNQARFVVREIPRKEGGQFNKHQYVVFERPQLQTMESVEIQENLENGVVEVFSPETAFPAPENPEPEKPAPENPHLLSNKITKYTTKAAAVTEVVKENASESERKKESAASFSNLKFAESDYTIGNELSEPQKQAIQRAVLELIECGVVVPTQQAFTHQQIAAMILSRKHFTKAGNEFSLKLNTIVCQLRQGALVLNRVKPIPMPMNPEQTALENELKRLCLDKYGQEQAVASMSKRLQDDPEKLTSYTNAFKGSIAERTQRIEKLRAQLSELKQKMLGA